MKKIKLLAFACTVIVGIAVTASSCSKNQTASAPAPAERTSTMSTSVDLENYVTTFTTNKDGSRTITFSEPDAMVLSASFVEPLGLKSATIPAGIYTINITKEGAASLDFPVTGVAGQGILEPTGITLYIARRQKVCGDDVFPSYCVCGIGFACGATYSEVTPYSEPVMGSVVRTGNQPTSLHFSFTNNDIDWKGISDGL